MQLESRGGNMAECKDKLVVERCIVDSDPVSARDCHAIRAMTITALNHGKKF